MPNEQQESSSRITRAQGQRMTLTVFITYLPLIPIFWFLVKPILITAVSEAVASDIKEQVTAGVQPINAAFRVLLLQEIEELKESIALLEYKEEHESETWTPSDVRTLSRKKNRLEALREARRAL